MSYLKPKILPPPINVRDTDLNRVLNDLIIELRQILNNGVRFEDNHDAKIVNYTSNATPDTEDTLAHTLGKIPTGYIVCGKNKAGIIYDGSTSWTATNIYLKCDTASVTFKLIIF